ncbi:TetR/AcrR family transcriptional regulator [Desulfobacterales bacterium HSG17]|nr:TetR/AcrR family transcriptional regulator [Desulfobacterales bacterium HSG17]
MKKRYHHGDLKNKLLETALEIISKEGLEKVSMRELGQRLGVSRSAPYRHFSDKSALLCTIAEQGFKELTDQINITNAQNANNPLNLITMVGIAYVKFALANPVHYRMMFGNEIVERKRTPELIRLVEEAFNSILKIINSCQAEGLVKPLNPYIVANTFWSITHGISTLLMDGQIQAANAFKGLPALTQTIEESGKADIDQIFEYIEGILATGIMV